MHPSAGVCANSGCNYAGLEQAPARSDTEDYYGWLGHQSPRRLAIAELTGQTKPLALQRQRQRWFKGALLAPPKENPRTTALAGEAFSASRHTEKKAFQGVGCH